MANNFLFTKGEIVGHKHHIPGYLGYIPHVVPGNIYGKTYGNITNQACY